jgi:hypothetical protein
VWASRITRRLGHEERANVKRVRFEVDHARLAVVVASDDRESS